MIKHIKTNISSRIIIEVGGCGGLSNNRIDDRISHMTKLVKKSNVFYMDNVLFLPSSDNESRITIIEYSI